MWIVPWNSFLVKVCMKKEVCRSCEQYIIVQNLLVKEVVGPVHSAMRLTDRQHPTWKNHSQLKKKRKKEEERKTLKRCPESPSKR